MKIQEGLDNVNEYQNQIKLLHFDNHQINKLLENSELTIEKNLVKFNQLIHEKEVINKKLVEAVDNNVKITDQLISIQMESDKCMKN